LPIAQRLFALRQNPGGDLDHRSNAWLSLELHSDSRLPGNGDKGAARSVAKTGTKIDRARLIARP